MPGGSLKYHLIARNKQSLGAPRVFFRLGSIGPDRPCFSGLKRRPPANPVAGFAMARRLVAGSPASHAPRPGPHVEVDHFWKTLSATVLEDVSLKVDSSESSKLIERS